MKRSVPLSARFFRLAAVLLLSHLASLTRLDAAEALRVWNLKDGTTFKAALVRVAGFDSERSKSYAVVQREDGRQRAYALESLSDMDRAYVQNQVKSAEQSSTNPPAAGDVYLVKPEGEDDDPVKAAGAFNEYLTPHFRFLWGNQIEDSAKNWADPKFRQMNFDYFEKVWDFYQKKGAPMPYSETKEKYKTNVFISGTGLAHHKDGFAFGGLSILMHPGALLEGSSVVPHEFTHTLQLHMGGFRDSPYVGWFWECHANWSGHQFIPSYPPALEVYADRMFYELSSSRMNYGSWPFLLYMAEDPRFTSAFCYDVWRENKKNEKGEAVEDPFQTMMRMGVERGLFKGDGTEGFGDVIGNMAAHNVSWDYVFQNVYQDYLAQHARNMGDAVRSRTVLEPVTDRPGWFKPLYSQSPRQYGINIVDLIPVPGARRIEVNFQGIVDETEGSDWRVTLVALDKQGRARYSPMWHNGKGQMVLQPGETKLAIAIAATPTIYKPLGFRIGFNAKRHYPYEVSFSGCQPAASAPWSLPPRGAGAPHPNGGGFVEATAKVAPLAYIGPNAAVLGRAQVLDNARIEDQAVVSEDAIVSQNAIISGQARIRGHAKIAGNARIRDEATINDDVQVEGNARVTELVRVSGNGPIRGDAFIKGSGQVDIFKNTELSGGIVLGEDLEVHTNDWKTGPLDYGLVYGFITNEQLEKERPDNHYLYAHWDFSQPRKSVLKDAFADNDGVLRGQPKFAQKDGRTALSLNGKNQYAVVEGSIVDTAGITLDMRLKWNGGTPAQRVFTFGSPSSSLTFAPTGVSGGTGAAFIMRQGAQTQVLRANRALPVGQWTRVTITLQGDVGKLYFDGALVGHNEAMTLHPGDLHVDAGFIGSGYGGQYPFNGELDDVAVYRKGFEDVGQIPAPQP